MPADFLVKQTYTITISSAVSFESPIQVFCRDYTNRNQPEDPSFLCQRLNMQLTHLTEQPHSFTILALTTNNAFKHVVMVAKISNEMNFFGDKRLMK